MLLGNNFIIPCYLFLGSCKIDKTSGKICLFCFFFVPLRSWTVSSETWKTFVLSATSRKTSMWSFWTGWISNFLKPISTSFGAQNGAISGLLLQMNLKIFLCRLQLPKLILFLWKGMASHLQSKLVSRLPRFCLYLWKQDLNFHLPLRNDFARKILTMPLLHLLPLHLPRLQPKNCLLLHHTREVLEVQKHHGCRLSHLCRLLQPEHRVCQTHNLHHQLQFLVGPKNLLTHHHHLEFSVTGQTNLLTHHVLVELMMGRENLHIHLLDM